MKDSIPANNLLHTFPEGDIARSLQIPAPTLELDFRMSIKMNPKVAVGPSIWGQRDWVTFIGGQWAGRWGKGIVLVSRPFVLCCEAVLTLFVARGTRLADCDQGICHQHAVELCPPNRG
jgi:hypothetical protein